MLAATAAERRFGPAVAGAMAAMPVALSIIVLAVGAELGRDAGATLAAGAAAHVVAQVAFAARLRRRRRPAAAPPLGLARRHRGLRRASRSLVAPIPPAVRDRRGVPALLLGTALIKGSDPSTLRLALKAPAQSESDC